MRTLTIWIVVLLAVVSTGCRHRKHHSNGGSGDDGDDAPRVTSTVPADGAANVSLSVSVRARFSEDMDPGTITTSSFQVTGVSNLPVSGVVTYDPAGFEAAFQPTLPLEPNTTYVGRVSEESRDLDGNALECEAVWIFTTGDADPTPDDTPPTVIDTHPANGQNPVALGQILLAMFSESMDPASIDPTTFLLEDSGGTPVAGAVEYHDGGFVATFDPAGPLDPGTVYFATITTGARDFAGNAMSADYTWTFSTGSGVDQTGPRVISTDPADSEIDVQTGQRITATFSETLDPASCDGLHFFVEGPGGVPVSGTVTCSGLVQTTIIFTPQGPLAPGTLYQATLTGDIMDLSGNMMGSDFVWSFTTGSGGDDLPPTVTGTCPSPFATGFGVNRNINATFSEALDPATVTGGTFTLTEEGGSGVPGVVSYLVPDFIAVLDPAVDLLPSTVYVARLTIGITDSSGNPMVEDFVWTFTTGTAPTGQPPVILNEAGRYAVLAGTSIDNLGPSIMSGDIGVYPGAVITGFPPGIVNGVQRVSPDPDVSQARTDLIAAFVDTSTRSAGAVVVPAELGGQVLLPGLYRSPTGSFSLTTGTVTLDAQGDPAAVWVFQMPGGLAFGSATQVLLVNGARASNIHWSVNLSVTAGSGALIQGTLIVCVSAEFAPTARVEGRALVILEDVRTDTNLITIP